MKLNPNIWDLYFHTTQKQMFIFQDVFDGPTLQAGKRPRGEGIVTFWTWTSSGCSESPQPRGKDKASLKWQLLTLAVQIGKDGQPCMVGQMYFSVDFAVLFSEYLHTRAYLSFWLFPASSCTEISFP